MHVSWLLTIYCLFIVLGSMFGGYLPSLVEFTHKRMQLLLSFVGGLMLGVGLFHLLPHGISEAGQVDLVVNWTMAGLLVMFFLIRLFHFHQHGSETTEHRHEVHKHCHHKDFHDEAPPVHRFSWIGVAFGLSLHTLIDGIALGAAVVVDSQHEGALPFDGAATFLAVWLHKPLDALAITSMMAAAGWASRSRQLVNLGFAMMCPVGAAAVMMGMGHVANQSTFIGCALGFSAGVFLCISLGDLLPEVQFHAHDRMKLSVALIFGIGLAYGLRYLEPGHAHRGHSGLHHVSHDHSTDQDHNH